MGSFYDIIYPLAFLVTTISRLRDTALRRDMPLGFPTRFSPTALGVGGHRRPTETNACRLGFGPWGCSGARMPALRHHGRRGDPAAPAQKSSSTWLYLTGAAAAGGLGYWYYTASGAPSAASTKVVNPTKEDYQKVYNEIASRLEEKDDYDDGSFGPVLLRLAWHASGTYDKETGTGGSNGATMRFAPESDHGANAGLLAARDFLAPVKGK